MTFIKNSMIIGKYKCRCGYEVEADRNLNLPIKKCPNCGSENIIEGAIARNYANFEKINSYGPFRFPSINQLVDYFEKDNEVYKENPKRIAY